MLSPSLIGGRPSLQRSLVSDAPRSALRSQSRYPGHDDNGGNRDWEGIVSNHRSQGGNVREYNRGETGFIPRNEDLNVSVAVFAQQDRNLGSKPIFVNNEPDAKDRPQYLADHQSFLESKRVEYLRRLDAEQRGEVYQARRPYSDGFAGTLPATYADAQGRVPLDFEARGREIMKPQVVGTRDEIAWLKPPVFPPPVGYNGFWDVCAGHEAIVQVMALSGANPNNSPSLTQHFMYPELLSSIQRLQYGTYLVHYQKGETPHERYFYVKSLPLANRGQFCPFFCWSVHRHSQTAVDAIPLCNVMWVTQGIDGSEQLQKYYIGGDYINGPYVGKYRSECLVHGAMTVWVYDGKKLRGIDVLATDPLVFALWMKLFEDFSQLNAVLDPTGNVRALQKDIEGAKSRDELATRDKFLKNRGTSFFK